jgi:hypothetical protein
MFNRLPPSILASFAVIAASCIVLLLIIASSPSHPVYDEIWFLDSLALLQRDGISMAFLRNLPGAPGPTSTIAYGIAVAVFGLQLPWLRLVGFTFLLASSGLLAAIFATRDVRIGDLSQPTNRFMQAGVFVTLPTTAVSCGMTLTEIPAIFFVLISTLLLGAIERDQKSSAASVVAGFMLGLAVLGRQNYLVIFPCLAVLVNWKLLRSSLGRLISVGLVAALICGPVFLVWGGLVPPKVAFYGLGEKITPWLFVLSLGYLGIVAFIIEPCIYAPIFNNWRKVIGATAVSLAIATSMARPIVPASTALSFLGETATWAIGWSFAWLIACLATAFLCAMGQRLYTQRSDRFMLFSGLVVIFGALSNANVILFSSRYVFVFLPFLLINLASSMKITWHLPVRLMTGSSIGLLSLASYFR